MTERFGDYELIRPLGSGGMATVFLAQKRSASDDGFTRLVALKRLLPALTADVELVSMLIDEAKLCAQLNHPNVVAVHDFGEVDGEYFFVMDYVHGVDLGALLKSAAKLGRGLTMSQSLTIVCHAAAGLHHAHDACDAEQRPLGIVHRDVSPTNILIGYDGTVKVADFGIAKARSRRTKTATGLVKGKVAYLSPEQCRAQPLDRRSDVFALGIVLFELSTGTRLFGSRMDDFAVMHALVNEPLPTPRSRRDKCPEELERIVMKALAQDPDERYPTTLALRRDLEAFARSEQLLLSETPLRDLMTTVFGDVPPPQLTAPSVEAATTTSLSSSSAAQRSLPSRGAFLVLAGTVLGAVVMTLVLLSRSQPSAASFVRAPLTPAYTRAQGAAPQPPVVATPSATASAPPPAPPRLLAPPRPIAPKPAAPPKGTDDELL